jgi:hypothetical protein
MCPIHSGRLPPASVGELLSLAVQMACDHAIARALRQIADVLTVARDYPKHLADIESLLSLARSETPEAQATFKKEITTNKWYWLGMGTITDISLADRALNRKCVSAYRDLAVACEQKGFGSIYSKDVEAIFGKWLRHGHV